MGIPKRTHHALLRTELANIKVLHEEGYSPNAIGKLAGRDPKTVRKWLQSEAYQEDPELQKLVDLVREKEIEDLTLIGAKARQRLHELIPQENKIIPLVAAIDRTFQQRRLLEGRRTANTNSLLYWYLEAEKQPPWSANSPVREIGNVIGAPSNEEHDFNLGPEN